MKNRLEQFNKDVKKVGMTSGDKSRVRTALLSFMKDHPVRADESGRLLYMTTRRSVWSFYKTLTPVTMALALVITLILGGGVSLAAERALPGDPFYSVKTHVNERVRGFIAVGADAEADLAVRLAERRLKEAESLAAKGELSDEAMENIENRFAIHAEAFKVKLQALEEKDVSAAADKNSNFETSLNAHARVLYSLKQRDGEAEDVAQKIKMRMGELSSYNQTLETKINSDSNINVEARAEGKLKASENVVSEVKNYFEKIKDKISAEAYLEAETEISKSEKLIAEGKVKMEAKNYAEAFILFNKAFRIAQEAKFTADHNLRLNINLKPLNSDSDDSVNATSTVEIKKDENDSDKQENDDEDIEGKLDLRGRLGL